MYEVLYDEGKRNKLAPRPSGEAEVCVEDEWKRAFIVQCWSLAKSGALFGVLTKVCA
jgi:hypothetical protein